jgi:hypothetical protein
VKDERPSALPENEGTVLPGFVCHDSISCICSKLPPNICPTQRAPKYVCETTKIIEHTTVPRINIDFGEKTQAMEIRIPITRVMLTVMDGNVTN